MIGLSMINAEHGRMLLQWEQFVNDCDHNAKSTRLRQWQIAKQCRHVARRELFTSAAACPNA